ncbi:MAG: 4Fe-4S dicluster domain-containing protein [Candidatus Bathyarchaeota archaeon]
MKRFKNEDKDRLFIGQALYVKRFGLTVDRRLCKGCMICKLVCPREAITLNPVSKGSDGKAQHPEVNVDENKCDFHAICATACPFGAIEVTINDKQTAPTVGKEAYPIFLRDIQIDSKRCVPDCRICAEKCPLGIISVTTEPLTTEEMKKKGLPATSKKTIVAVKKELCAACRICEVECPAKAIQVTKLFDGFIRINQERCIEDCHDCLDVCPVNALYLEEDGKVCVKDIFCIYCGACANVCPKPEALELTRTSVHHTPIKSGAWNKALEKLTSTSGLERELKAKRMGKAREAIKNLRLE